MRGSSDRHHVRVPAFSLLGSEQQATETGRTWAMAYTEMESYGALLRGDSSQSKEPL